MRTVADSTQEIAQTLADEIALAREEARPISRLTLARVLVAKYSYHPHDAERIVDRYCDDKAPGIPTYLSSEFGVPYLKVLAIVNGVAGIILLIISLVVMDRPNVPIWPWLSSGTFFLLIGAFCLFRTLQKERTKDKGKKLITGIPSIASIQEPAPDLTAKTPLQPRS